MNLTNIYNNNKKLNSHDHNSSRHSSFRHPYVSMDNDEFVTKKTKELKPHSQSHRNNHQTKMLGVSLVELHFCHVTISSSNTQKNAGNNALGQSGQGRNSADQSISKSQSSRQTSHVVCGGNTIGSGNNIPCRTYIIIMLYLPIQKRDGRSIAIYHLVCQ